jgi:hypothetical protein
VRPLLLPGLAVDPVGGVDDTLHRFVAESEFAGGVVDRLACRTRPLLRFEWLERVDKLELLGDLLGFGEPECRPQVSGKQPCAN